VDKDTEIIMSDFTIKQIKDIEIGDSILGFEENVTKNKYRKYFPAIVTETFKRKSKVIKLTLENGKEIIITSNHPILSGRNWWRKAGEINPEAKSYNKVKCLDLNIPKNVEIKEDKYNIGYLISALLGDGSIKKYPDKRWENQWFVRIRLAVNDNEILEKCDEILQSYNIDFYRKEFDMGYEKSCNAIFSSKLETYEKLTNFINEHFRNNKNIDYCKGFLSGIYDTEGCFSCGQISISNKDTDIIKEIKRCLDTLNIGYKESFYKDKDIWVIRILKHQDQLDFIKKVVPQIERKGIINLYGRSNFNNLSVSKVEELDEIDVYNLETTSHTYIANKICVHNCFEKNKGQDDMDEEKLLEYYSHNPCTSTFPFGGEPLLKLDLLLKIIDQVENNRKINTKRKKELIKKLKVVITNGTLIKHNLKKIKDYGLEMQISFDGPQYVHDSYRVFPNGKGTYDKCIEAVEICVKENIPWSVHGVMAKDTLKYFSETFIWFFEIYKKYRGLEHAIGHMRHNNFQIIFEDEYTDEDIDTILEQFHKVADWIYTREYMTIEQKDTLFSNFLEKHGGVCSVGTTLLAFDTNLDIYPCHRLGVVPEKKKYLLGNAMDISTLQNFKMYNSYYNIGRGRKYMYSAITHNHNFKNLDQLRWFMWCPATNYQTSTTVYYQSAKYNVMFTEINRFVNELKKVYYQGSDKKPNKQNNQCNLK
jgi:sulfatase maturation enzyme AslB (radical SAM superfamily)